MAPSCPPKGGHFKRICAPAWSCSFFLMVMLVGAGCGSSEANLREDLPLSLDDFHSHLIWGRYSEAAGYLPENQRGHFLGVQEEIGDELRYTEYEIGSIDLNRSSEEAVVTVTLKWYRVPQYIIQTTRLRETWSYDDDAEMWWLTDRVVADNSQGQ